jgi:hypothetical protein
MFVFDCGCLATNSLLFETIFSDFKAVEKTEGQNFAIKFYE